MITQRDETARRLGRLARAGVFTALAIAVPVPAGAQSPGPDPAGFRLGNAARPFGWSTAVGDFNRDGTPDVATADRVGQRPGAAGYSYRLELSISGQGSNDVSFDSADSAVTISASDVDDDNDLDIIVRRPLSGDTLGVWLNDGSGHFTSSDARSFRESIQPLEALGTIDLVVALKAVESSPSGAHHVVPAACGAAPGDSAGHTAIPSGDLHHVSAALVRSASRAPPLLLD